MSVRRTGWTIATLLVMAVIASIVVPWLLRVGEPRTRILVVSFDDYAEQIQPVPYGKEDAEALSKLAFEDWRTVKNLSGKTYLAKDTRNELENFAPAEHANIRGDDVFVAVIRGQTTVAKLGDARASWRASLMPEDFSIGTGVEPPVSDVVPLRTVVEKKLLGTKAATTLVAIDLGDLRWDPRLGIVAGLVPSQLDDEIPSWLANAKPPRGRSAWVLTSHDAFEFSGVSVAARRSFFSRALELALAGRADERDFGGNGDRWVELDELVRFVAAQTHAWAKADGGPGAGQHPVLWRLFDGRGQAAGRVEPGDVPAGVRITRVTAPNPPPSAQITAKPTSGAGGSARVAAAPPATQPEGGDEARPQDTEPRGDTPGGGTPSADGAPPVADDREPLWLLFDAVAGRTSAQPSFGRIAGDGDEPNVLDYAPHVWRALESNAAREACAHLIGGPPEADAKTVWSDLLRWAQEPSYAGTDGAVRRLERARKRATEGEPWRTNDPDVRAAADAASRCLDTLWAVCGWRALRTGGVRELIFDEKLVDDVARLREALEKVHKEGAERDDKLWNDLRSAKGDVESSIGRLRGEVSGEIDDRLEEFDKAVKGADGQAPHRFGSAELRWLASSRLLTAKQRVRLDTLCRELLAKSRAIDTKGVDGGGSAETSQARASGSSEAGESGPQGTAAERWLRPLENIRPAEPDRLSAPWANVSKHLALLKKLFSVVSAQEPPVSGAEGVAPVAGSGSAGDGDTSGMAVALEAAWDFAARMQADTPNDLDPIAEDLLLRRLDPRDVFGELLGNRQDGLERIGWLPFVRQRPIPTAPQRTAPSAVPSSLKLVVTGAADSVGAAGGKHTRFERTFTALGSGDPAAWSSAKVPLRSFPGRTTRWTMELANETGEARDVSIDVVRLTDPAKDRVPGAVDPSQEWGRLLAAAGRKGGTLAGFRVIGRVDRLGLDAGASVRVPALVPLSGGSSPGAGVLPDRPVAGEITGASLAIVITDRTDPAPSDAAGPAGATAARPPREVQTWIVPIEITVIHPRDYVRAEASINLRRQVVIEVTADEAWFQDTAAEQEITVSAAETLARLAPKSGDSPELRMEQDKTILKRGVRSAELRGEWKGTDGSAIIALDVDGYPRSHVFEVSVGDPKRGPARSWWSIAILNPPAPSSGDFGPCFKNREPVQLGLAIDFPVQRTRADSSPLASVWLQNLGRSEGEPRKAWWTNVDRRVTHRLASPDDLTLAVTTTVEDWTTDLDPGMTDTDARIVAELMGEGSPKGDTLRDERRIVIDGTAPRLETTDGRQRERCTKGARHEWLLRASDGDPGAPRDPVAGKGNVGAAGIRYVEWGLDEKGSGLPSKPERAPRPSADGTVKIVVQTASLDIGRHQFVAIAVDALDNKSEPVTLDLEVIPPAPPDASTATAKVDDGRAPTKKNGSLEVTVKFNGKPSQHFPQIDITLEGPAGTKTKKTENGKAIFGQLPPGTYTLKVPREIVHKNVETSPDAHTREVDVEPGKKATASIDYRNDR